MDLADIYENFRVPLKSFISKRIANADLAEDLVHDIFLKIHSQLGNLRDEQTLSAWIYQIARNSVIDFYRRKKIDHPLQIEEDLLKTDQTQSPDVAEKLSPALHQMIDSLPDKYRDALQLSEFEGKKHADISRLYGISLSAAKSRVQRARRMLKKKLLECCHFEFDKYGTVFDYSPRKCNCCEEKGCEPAC